MRPLLKPPLFRWRMTDWLLLALALAALVWLLAPQQLPVSLYKMSLLTMAAVAGYWIDRSLFPYARPGRFADGDAPLLVQEVDGPPAECGNDDVCTLAVLPDGGEKALLMAAAMLRRAVIVAAAMLAVGLGA